LSFGHGKPLHIGRGGAILLDDKEAYNNIIRMRYDGRDLSITPWQQQQTFRVGYHYKPTPEEAVHGIALLEGLKEMPVKPVYVEYPDLRNIKIVD
jgi:dTDP-4-amino-4,6-dideoxygalactose transaminase